MTIPANNRFFQRKFKGYNVHGRHDCVPQFDYQNGNSSTKITPIRGDKIVVLDDSAYDPQTGRPRGNNLIAPYDTREYKIQDSKANRTTIGFDGAILECRNVKISSQSALWYLWSFLPYESHSSNVFNSFALFSAYNKSDLNADGSFDGVSPIFTEVLGESKKINDVFRNDISWTASSWRPKDTFVGTLCWVVSSGIYGSTNQLPRPANLLLDSIDISRRT